jgi:hypothetical protein
MANRQEDFERMKARKRVYHRRLRRVIEGIAWCNNREVPTDEDYDEAQRQMRAQYMEIVTW